MDVSVGECGTILVAPAASIGDGSAPARGPDFTRAVLDVAGAVLTWPVLGAPGPPSAQVHDAGRAQQWLWALYGERVALAVHERATGRAAGSPARVRVPADLTALAGDAARLALGHWTARWWPASYPDGIPVLAPDVLGVETAALTHRCQQLFDDGGDQPDDCAAELVDEHRAALAPLIQWWHAAPPSTPTARRLEAVLFLVDAAADAAGLDGPALRHLRAALAERPSTGAPADPGTLFARRTGYALAAGAPTAAGGRVIARGAGTNDWRRYPPGFVDAAEDAVSWTARALGAQRRIEVEVLAHGRAPAGAPLVAEVCVNGVHRGRVPLARRDDLWAGHGDLDLNGGPAPGVQLPRVEVAVVLPGFDPGPAPEPSIGPDAVPGAGAVDDRAARDAVRALARRRLAAAAPDLPYDVPPHAAASVPFLAETAAAAIAADEDY
ncbi:hypothetical protein [Streptomyces sp. NPDC017940]|uniref:hypothetical protein n=1 Tax=Streptomyces sp. NPDC017940 TaxID=3365017 RepID=UPI0037AE707F